VNTSFMFLNKKPELFSNRKWFPINKSNQFDARFAPKGASVAANTVNLMFVRMKFDSHLRANV